MARFDDELTEKAVGCYFRWCEWNGFIPQQPDRTESGLEGDDLIVLRNVRDELARYEILPGDRLRRVETPETADA